MVLPFTWHIWKYSEMHKVAFKFLGQVGGTSKYEGV